jgi:S-(hydroxymethyl)glutathione dehydrogenase / alcohol dehydrogenase
MKAVVFHKPKDVRVETVDDPKIQAPSDAIIRVTSSAICGSDLHIYNGMIPQPHSMVLGHEFMGVVEEVGSSVTKLKRGDRVIVPFPIACGHCHFCAMDLPTHCENSNPKMYGPEGEIIKMKGAGAALYGYTDLYGAINGGQAEYARVLYADYSPRIVPDGIPDEKILFLTDIFPTGWAACEWAQVTDGDVVVVFGCGPVGIMAQKAAWLHGAKRVVGVDRLPYRMEMARLAANSETLNYEETNVAEAVREMTGGYGADVCIDAVGMEAHRTTIEKVVNVVQAEKGSMAVIKQCFDAVRRGGRVSVVGVYGSPYDNFPVYQWFEKSIQLMGGQAPVQRWIDKLIDLVTEGKVKLDDVITHRVSLAEAEKMYDIFNKKEDGCVKVVLNP